MEETLKIFNIEKQEPQRDLYNIAGNLIINPITHEPVYIPSIQSVLRKGETTEGDFFKKEPEWVDYEQGFIVERKEVDGIIKKLETNKVQLVLGAPASGKSIILKNVGFRLAKENKKVYVVELKKHPIDEIKLFFENIPKMDDDSIFIVDDAHLYLSECDSLIRNFKGRGKGKLIIGSRETREMTEGDPTESSEFEHLSKTALHIQAEDVTEGMIQIFLKARHHFSNDRIKYVSDNLREYKKDLWLLSWALKSYKPEKDSVEKNEIYGKVKDRIKKINSADALLPLSILYRFEIPVERKFLEKQLGIEGSTIERLIGISEILEIEEIGKPLMLSLHHSSLAELYFGTYENYPSLGERIRDKILIQKDGLQYCLFYKYITTEPRNIVDILIRLGSTGTWFSLIYWENKKILLKKLIKEDQIQKSIKKGLEDETDIGKIGECILRIAEADEDVGLEFANRIDIDALLLKIEKEKDLMKIGNCIWEIAIANKKVGLKLATQINVDNLLLKIEKEKDMGKIESCVATIAKLNKGVGLKLLDSVSQKIEKEDDIHKIGLCVSRIATANEEVGLELANHIDINTLSLKTEKEEKANINICVSYIADASEEVALKLVGALSAKINKEENVNNSLAWYYYMIWQAHNEIDTEIVNNLNPKIREELQKLIESHVQK